MNPRDVFYSIFVLFTYTYVQIRFVSAAKSSKAETNRNSLEIVVALVDQNFNEKCSLRMKNCLFQNQWEKLLVADKRKREIEATPLKRFIRTANENSASYCQAFILARYCIEEHSKKYKNELPECFQESNGNSAKHFKNSINYHNCDKHYKRFYSDYSESLFFKSNSANFGRYTYFNLFALNVFLFFNIF